MSDISHKLKALGIFQNLNDRELKEIASNFKIMQIKNRATLFEENLPIDCLYLILYGSFKIQKTDATGATVILNFLGRGEFLGIAMVDLFSPVYPATAVAIEDSGLLCFSRSFFREHLMQHSQIKDIVTRQVGERFMEFQNDRCMERTHIPQKLADFLLRLLGRQNSCSGQQILFPITRKDMALRIGTHTETVIRVLSDWTKKGIIKTKDRHVEIVDVQYLQEIRNERSFEPIKTTAPNYSGNARQT